jgi:hypothetical protein
MTLDLKSPQPCGGARVDKTTAMPYYQLMFEFIETPFFTRAIARYLDDDEYADLQSHLNKNPTAGVVVPDSGGVRKLRWGAEGRGKRGGLRVIYFTRLARGQIWMLTVYGKSAQENVAARTLRAMKKAIEYEKDD